MKAEDNADTLTLMFESSKQDRISDFDLKLMSIESEHLGIPDQDYSAEIKMPSSEYQRIMRDLASIGDTVLISATKEGVKFSTTGEVGTANITVRWGVIRGSRMAWQCQARMHAWLHGGVFYGPCTHVRVCACMQGEAEPDYSFTHKGGGHCCEAACTCSVVQRPCMVMYCCCQVQRHG